MNRAPLAAVPGLAARSAAQAALGRSLRKRRRLDAALDEVLSAAGLSLRDAGFARAIANETMRRFGQLDDLLRGFMRETPAPHRAGGTLEILLAGACELLFLQTPAHAAVDAANALAARDGQAIHFKPLINAVLRRIAREGRGIADAQDAVRINTPDWLWTRWCSSFGEAATHEIARAHLHPAPLDVLTKDSRARGIGAGVALPGGVWRIPKAGPVTALPGFAQGEWWAQDFAASLPARLFGDLRGKRILDLCAAPGGKTAQLAHAGADVTALERDASRIARIAENLDRLDLAATLVQADVRDFVPDAAAECVLLDAPCSGSGTIRRNPEIPWIKDAADVLSCAQAGAELLTAAAEMVAPGGTLVFAVCSLEEEEGCGQIAQFLRRRADFARIPLAAREVFGMRELVTAEGDLRTLPCHLAELGGMDGFYAARLSRLRQAP